MARGRVEDRNRLAVELHDSLGHELSLLAVQAGALTVADARSVPVLAERIRGLAHQALEELRQIVSILHDQEPGGGRLLTLASLPCMIGRIRDAGLPVSLDVAADLDDLPDGLDRLAFRIVQESLTNVLKHAPGAPVEVLLHRLPGLLEVTVANGPAAAPGTGTPASGYGLRGLAGRVAQAGGALNWGPDPSGGWTVHAALPLDG